ncbi:hypothetical protein LCGC14_1356600 [marine sediment metagenome]|uniref:Uncharacterized protein n=1 Tax=marine sediment metagenome TaxID=412755 RepID=A0A0F9NBQ0_9ZZZZ
MDWEKMDEKTLAICDAFAGKFFNKTYDCLSSDEQSFIWDSVTQTVGRIRERYPDGVS